VESWGPSLSRTRVLLGIALVIVAIDGVVIAARFGDDAPGGAAREVAPTTTPSGPSGLAPASSTTTTSTSTAPNATTGPSSTGAATTTTAATAPAGERVVVELTGDGDTNASAPFTVTGRWELRWTVSDGGAGVALTIDDRATNTERDFEGLTPGSDRKAFDGGCDCTITLVPDGTSYDVAIVDVVG
jgi:cytoskeletal protein RodZ